LSSGLGRAGELEEALAHCRKAEEYLARAEQRNPGLEQTLSRRFDVVTTRAESYANRKRWPEAIAAFRESVRMLNELRRRDPKSETYLNDQVGNGMELAECYADAGQWAAAKASMNAAMSAFGRDRIAKDVEGGRGKQAPRGDIEGGAVGEAVTNRPASFV
jgi:tetratricopeptide (TPR) repeat protein